MRHLHAERGLVGLDARLEHRVAGMLLLVLAVEPLQQAEFRLLQFGRRGAAVQIGNRFRPAGDARSGIDSGEEVGRPDLAAGVRQLRREHHVARQVLILGTQAVVTQDPTLGRLNVTDPVWMPKVAWK